MKTDFLSHLIIKKVVSVTSMYTEEGTKIKKRKRPGWAIVIKYEGETVYSQNGKDFISDAEHILILPNGCEYEWQCTKSGHFIIAEFDCDAEYGEIIQFAVKSVEKYLQQLQRLEYMLTFESPVNAIEAVRDVYSIILSLVQNPKGYMPSDKQNKITPVLEYIAKNYNTPLKNEQLAKIAGVSCVYFRKLFAEVTGESPIAYAHSLRIKKACEMLKSDYGSIADIAHTLGYPNIYDFSRDFKKHTGKPPSKY